MRILLLDDDQDSRHTAAQFLQDLGHEVVQCAEAQEALGKWEQADFPFVLADIHMPGLSGVEMTRRLKALADGWRSDVVLMTGDRQPELILEALRAGAYDYLLKPLAAADLAAIAERVGEHQALRRENRHLSSRFDAAVQEATGETRQELQRLKKKLAQVEGNRPCFVSPAMAFLADLAEKYHADPALPVLIEGETGTGKEVLARLIHYGSRGDGSGPFVAVNCAALTPALFESELFGYEAGAFTGSSVKGSKGKLDAAAGGTLFLDEVAELPPEHQAKLLRLLQEREYYRVGGLKRLTSDARVICATNARIKEQVESGQFRQDFYYRLQLGHLYIPPLRQRREDILPLSLTFLQESVRQRGKHFRGFSAEAAAWLAGREWPGNVRELRNVIEWVVFMFDGEVVTPEQLRASQRPQQEVTAGPSEAAWLTLPPPAAEVQMEQYAQLILKRILCDTKGNQQEAARLLGISRSTVTRMLRRS